MYCNKPKSTVDRNYLIQELHRQMAIFLHQTNDQFRYTLRDHLLKLYPGYDWTVNSYDAVGGWSTHAFTGYCGHVWRYKNKNVVACYARKGKSIPSASKQTEIAAATLAAIKDKVSDVF